MSMSQPSHRDEIDLIDIWLAFKQHYRAFLAVFTGVAVVGAAVVLLLPDRHAYQATLKIGGFRDEGGFQLVEPAETVKAELESVHFPQALSAYRDRNEAFPAGLLNPEVKVLKGGNLVTLQVTGSPEEEQSLRRILGEVAAAQLAAHNRILEERIRNRRSMLESQTAGLEARIASLERTRDAITRTGDVATQTLAQVMLDTQLESARAELATTQQLTVDLDTDIRRSELIRPPARSLAGSRPGTPILLALVFMLAFIAGCGAVLLRAFLAAARTRELSGPEAHTGATQLPGAGSRVHRVG